MKTKKQLETEADGIINSVAAAANPKDKFCLIWNGTIRPLLELVKSFTGPRIDEQINKLEHAADAVCDGTNPDVKNYCNVWRTFHLKAVLKTIQLFTGPKVDTVINKFIEISEGFCPEA